MNVQPTDFQGVIDLDRRLVEKLEKFLQEKEDRLAHQILNMISPSLNEIQSPLLQGPEAMIKLSDALEGLNKKSRHSNNGEINHSFSDLHPKQMVKEVNAVLWEFTEVLEGCVVELFQQIQQVPVNYWHISISEVVQAIKDILVHYIDDLIWIIRRLEKPLTEFWTKSYEKGGKSWKGWFSFRESSLDPYLLKNLQQTEKFLNTQYKDFQRRYHTYMRLNIQVEKFLEKIKNYPILGLLDTADQVLYLDIFRLLKMVEINLHSNKEVTAETARALKHLTSIENVMKIFRIYYSKLKETLFNNSLEWKSFTHDEKDVQVNSEKMGEMSMENQQELQTLMHTMSSYRTFILKNDPNPYVRSRWGFSERIVGPEPIKAKKLATLIYTVNELNEYFSRFNAALTSDPVIKQKIETEGGQEIEKLLHKMGQPLISRSMMRSHVESLLEKLRIMDEIGSRNLSMIDYVEDVLSKMMHQDWKYNTLHEFPLFHEIYHLHQGLVEYFDDPAHIFRLERFNLLFEKIKQWVEKEDIYSHVHEINLDVNDMKTYLQDFLATIQRAAKEKSNDPFFDETIYKFRQQLLEYRYLFGQFFLSITSKSSDGVLLRNQFLFVDQYFESAESQLAELIVEWKGGR